MPNSHQTSFNRVMKDCPTYGVPTKGHLQGQTRDYLNTHIFHTKKEHIYMCSYIISVVSYLDKRDSLCFIILHTKMECIYRRKFAKNKKNETNEARL